MSGKGIVEKFYLKETEWRFVAIEIDRKRINEDYRSLSSVFSINIFRICHISESVDISESVMSRSRVAESDIDSRPVFQILLTQGRIFEKVIRFVLVIKADPIFH